MEDSVYIYNYCDESGILCGNTNEWGVKRDMEIGYQKKVTNDNSLGFYIIGCGGGNGFGGYSNEIILDKKLNRLFSDIDIESAYFCGGETGSKVFMLERKNSDSKYNVLLGNGKFLGWYDYISYDGVGDVLKVRRNTPSLGEALFNREDGTRITDWYWSGWLGFCDGFVRYSENGKEYKYIVVHQGNGDNNDNFMTPEGKILKPGEGFYNLGYDCGFRKRVYFNGDEKKHYCIVKKLIPIEIGSRIYDVEIYNYIDLDGNYKFGNYWYYYGVKDKNLHLVHYNEKTKTYDRLKNIKGLNGENNLYCVMLDLKNKEENA